LKLDIKTGNIYDVGTKHCCGRLKKEKLAAVRDELKKSADFRDRVMALKSTSPRRSKQLGSGT
jgi:hypothetical protein